LRTGFLGVVLAIAALTGPALAADDVDSGEGKLDPSTDLSIRVGIGGLVQPDWEGSDEYDIEPWPIVQLEFLRLPGLGEFGGRRRGFAIGPSFAFIGERDQFSDPALIGLGNVDSTVEVGLKALYEVDYWGAYAALRHGFGGHDGLVGEASVYAVWRPFEKFVLRAGPTVSYADSDYFNTYFSVSPGQSLASGLPVYNAGSGFKSVGLLGLATYELTDKVDLHFTAGYTRLINGAGDSPIIAAAGSRDQFTAGVALSYRIDLDLFD
jgi:MipA family protein